MPRSTKAQADENRQRLLDEARRQFAEKGFHGTSISSVAGSLGLTKQTLLHHFGSKEQLFSEVLETIAVSLNERLNKALREDVDPTARLVSFMIAALDGQPGQETQIIIRELLENSDRAREARHWHLKRYLETLAGMVRSIPGRETLSDAEAFSLFYAIQGAISYFSISRPTLTAMFGSDEYAKIEQAYRKLILQFIEQGAS